MKATIYFSRFVLVCIFNFAASGYLQAQSNPGSLSKLAELTDIPGFVMDAVVKNGYLYVGGYTYVNSALVGYMRVYDFSAPSAPVFKTAVTVAGKKLNVMMEENGLIYLVGDNGLVVYNVANPLSPTLVASHDCITAAGTQRCFRDGYLNIAKSGNTLFVNRSLWGLNVFNIANLQSPAYLDGFEFNFDTVRDYIVLSGTELLLNDGGGLRSVNFSNPSDIVVMPDTDSRYVDLPGETENWVLTSNKSTAYVYSYGTNTSAVSIVDVSSRTILATVDIKAQSSLGGRMRLNAAETKLFIGTMEFNIVNRSALTFVGYNTYDSPFFYDGTGNVLIAKRFNDRLWVMGTASTVIAPTASEGTNITPTSFVAGWSSVAGAASYRLDVTSNNFTTFVTGYNGKTISGTSETVTGLTAGTTYSYRVRAVNTAGASSANSNSISVTTSTTAGTPTITSFTPVSGPVGTAVTITGSNFSTTAASNSVKFNGVAATVTASTATSITTTVPAGATTGTISIAVGTNTATSSSSYTVTAGTAPAITSFAPANGPIGTTVTISGANFSATAANNTVKFNGVTATVSASNATSITTSVPAGATTGTISVTVAGNTATSTSAFTITIGTAPAIASFTPASGPVGTTVTISGANFSPTAANNTVKFNGVTAVVSASTATSITTSVPAGAATGAITVTVGANTIAAATNFTVTSATAPTIESFSPTTGPAGTPVTIIGTNFSTTPGNNTVLFNGVPAAISSSTTTSITTVVPGSATSGAISVTVGPNSVTSTSHFTVVTGPAPEITSFTPSSGPAGTLVTIRGVNFSTTPADNIVKFNGVTATVSGSTATSISTSVPASAVTGPISVTVGSQTSISTTNFTVPVPMHSVTSFSPTSGPPGTTVTLTGSNFSPIPQNNVVKFNGVIATVSSSTATTIVVAVPAGATTGAITVTVGALTASTGISFTVTPCVSPSKPTIAASGLDTEFPVLMSSTASGYQWFKNGAVIIGATNATLTVTTPGIYTVQVSAAGGCFSVSSDGYELVVTGVITRTDAGVRFYPNPVAATLTFEAPEAGSKTLRVFSTDGRLMAQTQFENTSMEVDVHQFEAGIYYFIINTVLGTTTGKILKK